MSHILDIPDIDFVEEEVKNEEITGIEYLDKPGENNIFSYQQRSDREELFKWKDKVLKSEKTNKFLINLISSYMNSDEEEEDFSPFDKYKQKLINYKLDFLLENKMFNLEETASIFRTDKKIKTIDKFCGILYCRSHMDFINKIYGKCPEIFSVTEVILSKVVQYGRHKVLKFLLEKFPQKVDIVLKEFNPYNLSYPSRYTKDIWDGWTWGNDECEKPVINGPEQKDFVETFTILDKLSEKYPLIKFTDEYKKDWLIRSLYTKSYYFIDYSFLLKYFGVENLKNKENILKLVDIIGYDNTWRLLCDMCDSEVLKILLEK